MSGRLVLSMQGKYHILPHMPKHSLQGEGAGDLVRNGSHEQVDVLDPMVGDGWMRYIICLDKGQFRGCKGVRMVTHVHRDQPFTQLCAKAAPPQPGSSASNPSPPPRAAVPHHPMMMYPLLPKVVSTTSV